MLQRSYLMLKFLVCGFWKMDAMVVWRWVLHEEGCKEILFLQNKWQPVPWKQAALCVGDGLAEWNNWSWELHSLCMCFGGTAFRLAFMWYQWADVLACCYLYRNWLCFGTCQLGSGSLTDLFGALVGVVWCFSLVVNLHLHWLLLR